MWIRKKDNSAFVIGEYVPASAVNLFLYPTPLVDDDGIRYPYVAFHDQKTREKLNLMVVDPAIDDSKQVNLWENRVTDGYQITEKTAIRIQKNVEIELDSWKDVCRRNIHEIYDLNRPTKLTFGDQTYDLDSAWNTTLSITVADAVVSRAENLRKPYVLYDADKQEVVVTDVELIAVVQSASDLINSYYHKYNKALRDLHNAGTHQQCYDVVEAFRVERG